MKEKESRKRRIPKINSLHFGGIRIAAGLITGAVIPFILWLVFDRFFIVPVIMGAVIIAAFFAVLAIEMRQDNGKVPYYEHGMKEKIPFDPETQYAVIRSSICTGEKTAGFKNKTDGHFTEVMVIRDPDDIERFKKIYGIEKIKTEY